MPADTKPIQTMPAAPAAPAPQPTPTVPTPAPSAPEKSSLDMFDDLPETPTAPAATPATKPDAKPEDVKPAAATKAAPVAPAMQAFDPDKESNVSRLRKWGRDLSEKLKPLEEQRTQWESEKQQLQTKLQELENKVPKTQADAEQNAQRIASMEKQLEAYEAKIRLQNYQESNEYQEKYQKPYQNAYRKGHSRVSQLMASVPTGEKDADGKDIMSERQGTPADFDEIYHAPLGQAWKLARQKFGDAAPTVMSLREVAADHAEAAIQAIAEYKEKGATLAKEEQARTSTMRTALEATWRKANESFSADPKRKAFWGRDEDDPEANKALEKGFAIADKAFNGDRDQMSPEERVLYDASIRHRVAGFSKLVYKHQKVMEENAALKKQLEELRGSAPAELETKGTETPGKNDDDKTWEESFDSRIPG